MTTIQQQPDFKASNSQEYWYDLREDWSLIEASFAKQYNIRIRNHTDMPWTEFCTLLSGLMPDTPLGSIVAIRAEKNKDILKSFTPEQKRIHREWELKLANKKLENPKQLEKDFEALTNAFKVMFGKKGVKQNE